MRTRALSPRLWIVAAATATVLVLAGCGSSSGPPAPTSGVGTVIDHAIPASISDIPLREPDGHTTTLGDLRGKTVVVSDSMTLCSEDCPLDTANVVAAARAADAAGLTGRVVFLTVTVDPARDTPRQLRAYRRLYDPHHQLPNWVLLTGTSASITRLWTYLGVFWHKVPEGNPPDRNWLTGKPLTYDVAHADEVLMFDPSGHERYVISGHANVPVSGNVPTTMRHYLNSLGDRHLFRPGAATWTPDDVLAGVSWLTGHRA
ncbi:MAG: SCO family protein [Nocardioides sp.]